MTSRSRVHMLARLTLVASVSLAAQTFTDAQSLTLTNVGGGFDQPVFACSPTGDGERLFVLERMTGRIRILKNGSTLSPDFLNIGSLISNVSERGLL
ncbi:MAG: hypothetical protein ACI841_005470, partial [Planctomycetota bacterium]